MTIIDEMSRYWPYNSNRCWVGMVSDSATNQRLTLFELTSKEISMTPLAGALTLALRFFCLKDVGISRLHGEPAPLYRVCKGAHEI